MFSYAVRVSNKLKSWKMNPSSSLLNLFRLLPLSLVISLSFTIIWPLVTLSIVDMQFNSVVFPEPDAPIIDRNSPSSTLKDILFIAFVRLPLLP